MLSKKMIVGSIALVVVSGLVARYVVGKTYGNTTESSIFSLSKTAARGTSGGLTPDSFGISQPAAAGYSGRAVEMRSVGMADGEVRAPMPNPVAPVAEADKRLIIQTGHLSLVVENVSDTIEKIAVLANKNGGYVVQRNYYRSETAPTGMVSIRIPAASFDKGLGAVRALGEVADESLTGTDVTADYTDLGSQLRNYRSAEAQLNEIMKRAGRITEVLEVHNQLTSIRNQIETIVGRMNYLEQSSSLSLLTINLSTDKSALPVVKEQGPQWKPLATFKEAVRSLVLTGQSLADVLIWLVAYIPVWLLILIPTWLIGKKLWVVFRHKL